MRWEIGPTMQPGIGAVWCPFLLPRGSSHWRFLLKKFVSLKYWHGKKIASVWHLNGSSKHKNRVSCSTNVTPKLRKVFRNSPKPRKIMSRCSITIKYKEMWSNKLQFHETLSSTRGFILIVWWVHASTSVPTMQQLGYLVLVEQVSCFVRSGRAPPP
jgi:hypothetical protein